MTVYTGKSSEYSSSELLCRAFQIEYGRVLKTNDVTRNRNGKPCFKNCKMPYFNISHSGEYVVCVFAEEEIGIDIQRIRRVPSAVVSRFLHTNSIDPFDQTLEWTKFESFAKMKGYGIPMDEDYQQGWFQHNADLNGYIITVCCQRKRDYALYSVMI